MAPYKKALAAFALAALVFHASTSRAAELTADQIVSKMYDKFISWDFKTMSYDEVRVTSYEMIQGGGKTTMPMSEENGATMKMRYFYEKPDRHGYRLLSEPVKDYWPGSPNQDGAIPMDHHWKEKVTTWYTLSRAKKTSAIDGHECYVVTLMPVLGKPSAYPMTWYVDAKDFVVRKFIFLINIGDKKVSATGLVKYENIQGYLLSSVAEWRTHLGGLPYVFVSRSDYTNYSFNMPLDPSVFKEEFPKDWFKNLGEAPYKDADKKR